MDALEAIFTRRSIRRYTDRKPDRQTVEILLKAGMQAPSASNTQAWALVVIDDPELLQAVPRFHPSARMLNEAALAILVCGDREKEASVDYLDQNCAAVTENILLAARALGLGAVWLGIHPRPERVEGMRKLLKVPERFIPLSLVSIGYPAEQPPKVDRFKPELVYHNRWGKPY